MYPQSYFAVQKIQMNSVILEASRVGNVGWGLFTTLLVAALAIVGCVIGAKLNKTGYFLSKSILKAKHQLTSCRVACSIGWVVVIALLVFFILAPKESSTETEEEVRFFFRTPEQES